MKFNETKKAADNAFSAGQFDKAIELYKQALEISPKNRQAQAQLRRAETNLALQSVKPDVPEAAIQLFKRSRSFINAGELSQAKKLLKDAILIAEKVGSDFIQARELLNNLPDAFTAEGFKTKALDELNLQQWERAEETLKTAINLDPTDDAFQVLYTHLRDLLRAQKLINQLDAGTKGNKVFAKTMNEVEEILKTTNETIALSRLWQEIVQLQGKVINRKREKDNLIRVGIWAVLAYTAVVLSLVLFIYLIPTNNILLECDSVKNDLEVYLKYPRYISNGDEGQIEVYLTNIGQTIIDTSVAIHFQGPANIGSDQNVFPFDSLNPGEKKVATTKFFLLEPFSIVSRPDKHVNFSISVENSNILCTPESLHIAIAPIYGLWKVVGTLWSLVGLTIIGLLRDRIINFLFNRK